jgi:hypothetical protein
MRAAIALIVLIIALQFLMGPIARALQWQRYSSHWIQWFLIGMAVVALWWFVLAMLADRRFVRAQQYVICTRCRYPLHSLPPRGVCPECGKGYNIGFVRNVWLKYCGDYDDEDTPMSTG